MPRGVVGCWLVQTSAILYLVDIEEKVYSTQVRLLGG